MEQVYVVAGGIVAGPAHAPVPLRAGELLGFPADLPHLYQADDTAEIVLTMIYPRQVADPGLVSRRLDPPS